MLTVTATKLRKDLFEILKRVESGEKVVISHKKKDVALLISTQKRDWRTKIREETETACTTGRNHQAH